MRKVIEMRQITKRFGSLLANDHVDFDLRAGEIHCLLGENGAGKTTLMNILYGMWEMDEGDVFVEGRKVHFSSPRDAMKERIGMVSQHFNLIPTLTVTQNIVLARIPSKNLLFIDKVEAKNRVLRLASALGFDIDPDRRVDTLSVGEQQRVEILKALYHDAKIIILDEPTAVLTPQETDELFGIIHKMTKEGRPVIIITHKLNEAMNSDRITVMRNGGVVFTKDTIATSKDELAEGMFGKRISMTTDSSGTSAGRPVLELKDVWTQGSGSNSLKGVSLTVSEGEIFGLAGVAGNGQNALVDVIMGICKPEKGTILIKGKSLTNASPKLCRNLRIGCIPEERKRTGMLHNISLAENLILGREEKSPFAKGTLLLYPSIRSFAKEMIHSFDIKASGINMPIQHLSGGNIQKVILAREFSADPELIIAAQPTRGLDAKTVAFVYAKLKEERDKGKAILLISYDLDEIFEISDRMGVFYNGRIQTVSHANAHEMGKMMVGIKMEA
jgi:simple sugar transport system ATP-binding protein